MTTLVLSHDAALNHLTPAGHPERPDRYRAVMDVLSGEIYAGLSREIAERGEISLAKLAHDDGYVERIAASIPDRGFVGIDGDTFLSPGTLDACLRALGGATRGVDAIMAGEATNAFLVMRPPGHHAEKDRAMGFCFFNTAAVAARYAQKAHGAERVVIMDFDVHHGNGTQDIFWNDASVLYASTHEMPPYPGTGAADERGAHGNIVNVPLRPGTDGEGFREAMTLGVLPRILAFRPDFLIISAGFDAHRRDPLATLRLEAEDFGWATRELMSVAAKTCKGRVLSVLEGGYDLVGLAESAGAHVSALMEA